PLVQDAPEAAALPLAGILLPAERLLRTRAPFGPRFPRAAPRQGREAGGEERRPGGWLHRVVLAVQFAGRRAHASADTRPGYAFANSSAQRPRSASSSTSGQTPATNSIRSPRLKR